LPVARARVRSFGPVDLRRLNGTGYEEIRYPAEIGSAALQPVVEPGFGELPGALDRGWRAAHIGGDLGSVESCEETQLDDAGGIGADRVLG